MEVQHAAMSRSFGRKSPTKFHENHVHMLLYKLNFEWNVVFLSGDAMPSMSSFSHGPTSVIPPHSGGQFGHVPNMNNMYPSGQSQPGMMSHSSGQYGHGPNGNSMYPSGQSQPGITLHIKKLHYQAEC